MKLIMVVFLVNTIAIYNSSARRMKNISLDSLAEISVKKETAFSLWMNYIKVGNYIFWTAVPLYVQKEMLIKMAVELGKDVDGLIASDFSHKFDFLDGRALNQLYGYYTKMRRTAVQNFEQLPVYLQEIAADMRGEIQKLTPLAFVSKILEKLDNLPQEKKFPVSYTDVIVDYISRGGGVNWANVPLDVQRNLLEKAAEEMGKSWKDLSFNDFYTKLECFNGYTLARILQYYSGIRKGAENHPQGMPEQIQDKIASLSSDKIKAMTAIDFIRFVLDSEASIVEPIITSEQKKQQLYVNAESIIYLMHEGENIFWAEMPLYIQMQLLQKAIQESEVEFTQIDSKFFYQHFQFLNGRTLQGMFKYLSGEFTKNYSELPEPFHSLITAEELGSIKNGVDFIKHILGIYLAGNKPICQNIQELVDLIEGKDGDINWARVTLPLQKELLNEVAEDLGIEVTVLDEDILKNKSIDLLWGNTLESFYNYYDSLLEKARGNYNSLPIFYRFFVTKEEAANLTTLGFIGKLLGINFESSESTAVIDNDSALDPLNDGIYSPQEKEWISSYFAIKDYHWEVIAKENPLQIAFYVRELAVCAAQAQGGEFKDLWKLLNNRYFGETAVPCLGRPLLSMIRYFGDSHSILNYLEEKGLIDTITEEVRQRLKDE